MEITGTVEKSLPAQKGQSKAGKEWIKRCMVVKTLGPYPKEIAIDFLNDKGDDLKTLTKGQEVTVSVDIESREHNGKYYTNVNGYKIKTDSDGPVNAPKAKPHVQREQPEPIGFPADNGDDLPY